MYDVRGKNSAGTIANPASGSNTQTYVVRKLADGNCWMVQNLNLNLSTSVSLNSTTSDLTEGRSWTPQYSTQTTGGTSWSQGNKDIARSYDPGENIYFDNGVGTGTFDAATINYSSYLSSGDPWYHIGNHYNWYAATAGTGTTAMTSGNATDSICPRGWKLPDNEGGKSFAGLLSDTYSLDDSTASSKKILQVPLNFVQSGEYNPSSAIVMARGSYGFWWSSTADSAYAYILYITTQASHMLPQQPNYTYYGLSIRCVAR